MRDIGRTAQATPITTPSTVDTTSASSISSIVAGSASPITSRALEPGLLVLTPQSP